MTSKRPCPLSLQRGLHILEVLTKHPAGGMRFGQLQNATGLAATPLTRLLHGLQEHGSIAQTRDGHYRLGRRFMHLLNHAQQWTGRGPKDLLARIGPVVDSLRDRTGQTAMFVQDDGVDMVSLYRAEHPDALPLMPVGGRMQSYGDHPWGWIFAFAVDETLELLQQRQELWRSWSGRDLPRRLRAEWHRLYTHGWVLQNDRRRHRLAAPLRSRRGELLGALVLGGNPLTLPKEHIPRAAKALVKASQDLSRQLGYPHANVWQDMPAL